jgi:hypothetical protein
MESSRPAWGCLDAREMQGAAAGHTVDPAIREHLASCGDCRGAVRELRGMVGQSTGAHDGRYRRALLARPGFWLLLVMLGGLAYGIWRWHGIKPPPAEQPITAEAQPVTAPPPRPKVRRPHPPRAGSDLVTETRGNDVASVIRKNQTGVRMCYERALRNEPRLSVRRLDVRLNVSPAGLVDQVSLAELPDAAPLSTCIRNIIRTWKFSPAPAAYETAFSLHLQPGE